MVSMLWESLKPKPPAPHILIVSQESTQTGTSNSQVLRGH